MTNDVERLRARDNNHAILAGETESDRWRRALAEKVETIVRLRGMTRHDAERAAFDIVVVEFLKRDASRHRSESLRPLWRPRDLGRDLAADRMGRASRMAALRLFGAMADPATAQGRRRSRSPGRCEVGAMTGVKIRDSERLRHRRKPADAAPAPAVADAPALIETRAERVMIDRWVAN
jgi:hypothetical protein